MKNGSLITARQDSVTKSGQTCQDIFQVFKCLMSYLHKSKFCPACENFSDKTGLVYTSKSCVIQFQELGNMGAESEKYQVGSRKIKCNNP